jgi:hypothetical protein
MKGKATMYRVEYRVNGVLYRAVVHAANVHDVIDRELALVRHLGRSGARKAFVSARRLA